MKLHRFILIFVVLASLSVAMRAQPLAAKSHPKMYYIDSSRLGRPYAKDPSVIRFKGSYWMYYSVPAGTTSSATASAPAGKGWAIGVAKSDDLINWHKAGEVLPVQEVEQSGIAAPGARVIRGQVHLFYQTYGRGKLDAICHATSSDGLNFDRDPSNPVYRPTDAAWSVGRAIDAEVYPHGNELWMFFATRDPEMKQQMVGLASAPLQSSFNRGTWRTVSVGGPTLKPELPWEGLCIEAPSVLRHGGKFFLFYAGNYNNAPQQIGVASSVDGKTWTRVSDQPLLRSGAPGTWNISESGHPGVFTDDDGRTYLFYQGNDDIGKTWFLSVVEIRWHRSKPYLVEP